MTGYQKGLDGEVLAGNYLQNLGMQILNTRYRANGGEIDIIANDKGKLRFVEVKFRPQGRLGSGLASVDDIKRKRVYNAAKAYKKQKRAVTSWQFDIIEISRAGIYFIEDATK